MKLTTNIILVGDKGSTSSYMFELRRNPLIISQCSLRISQESDGGRYAALFKSNDRIQEWERRENEWYPVEEIGSNYQIETSTIRLYFPQYSVDTYLSGATYAIDITTHIRGLEIQLGSYIFKRVNSKSSLQAVDRSE